MSERLYSALKELRDRVGDPLGLNIKLQPKQLLFEKTIEEVPVTFYGGAKGGGKSAGLRFILLKRRIQYAGSHGAIFRRTYPELEGNHIRPMLERFPQLRPYYSETKKLLTLPNGSTLQFCHCENEKDVELYQGREFHDLGIDEAGQWTEQMIRRLLGSNRSSKKGIKPRAMLTGNPGGIGHAFLKRLFVEKRYKPKERPPDYAFIQALVDDNPALIENDPDYVYRLDAEPNEALRRAYRHGDWDIFAGQFFSEIRREIHFIKRFDIPPHWNRFGSYDYGFNHPAAFGWFAVDEDGNVYLYRELIQAQMRIDQFCQTLVSYPETKNLDRIVGGHDCWATKGVMKENDPPTIAEGFEAFDLYLTRATIDRIQGASQLRQYLAWNGRPGNKPRFYIMDSCPVSFDTLSRMLTDPDRPEDVLKVDAVEGDPNTGDDAYDMIRMGLMSRPILTDPVPVRLVAGSPEWQKKEEEQMEEAAQDALRRRQEDESWLNPLEL